MEGKGTYSGYLRHKWIVLMILLLILLAMGVLSLSAGSAALSPSDVLRALFMKGRGQESMIVWNIRMPRIAAAAAVGAALSLSGCIMQNVLRNPLASSSTLGVSQGASFGAASAIILLDAGSQGGSGFIPSISEPYMVSLCAFAGGMITTAVILAISRFRSSSPSVMVLAGVAVSSMFSGATTLIQYFADDTMVASIVYWTFGSLSRASWREIGAIAALSAAAFIFFMLNRWNYNAIESGRHSAKSLGVNVDLLVPLSLAVCALITSVAVAFTGCIGFIGLIAPHIMRRAVGNDWRFLIPGSALCGAALLLAADIACRTAAAPVVLPVGAITSFVGAPLFLYLVIRKGGKP